MREKNHRAIAFKHGYISNCIHNHAYPSGFQCRHQIKVNTPSTPGIRSSHSILVVPKHLSNFYNNKTLILFFSYYLVYY